MSEQDSAKTSGKSADSDPVVLPPSTTEPDAGTANVRIPSGFPIHVFIPWPELQINQITWTNVPQSELAQITQLAAENQVLLEIVEGS